MKRVKEICNNFEAMRGVKIEKNEELLTNSITKGGAYFRALYI